jgi:hypothetical protein
VTFLFNGQSCSLRLDSEAEIEVLFLQTVKGIDAAVRFGAELSTNNNPRLLLVCLLVGAVDFPLLWRLREAVLQFRPSADLFIFFAVPTNEESAVHNGITAKNLLTKIFL